jgi:hypothetical protein
MFNGTIKITNHEKDNYKPLVLIMGFEFSSQVENEAVALGLPGDNLNLYAVLDVFKIQKQWRNSKEQINTRDANINNLDLNNDNHVDYISVLSYDQGQFYSIVLRVAVSSTEFQDVAVIEVSKIIVELLCRSLGMRLYMVEIIL